MNKLCLLLILLLTACSSDNNTYAHNWDSMTYDFETAQVPSSFLASLTEKIK